MDELKLRNCPFCGDNQQLNYVELSNGLHYIECARCGAAPHRLGARDRETAVKFWNRSACTDDDTAEWIDKEVRGTMTNVCSKCGSCSVYPDKYCGGCGRSMKNGY